MNRAQLEQRREGNRQRVKQRALELGEFTLSEIHQALRFVPYQSVSMELLALWRDGTLLRLDENDEWREGRFFSRPPRTHVARYRVTGL